MAFPFIKILPHIKAREDKKKAMTKRLIALTMIIGLLSLTACGTQTTTSETESQTEQISTEAVTPETETSSLEQETTETEFIEETDTTSETLSESAEITNSKWADINGAWDAVHQFTLYAREQGADYTDGWCWCYDHGKGAGDQPSYAVYMKEGDPLYGTVYHVGDYLPDGTQFSGTNDEWEAFIKQDFRDRAEADGYDVYDDPDGDGFIIDLDGSYNPNSNTTSQPAQSSEEQTVDGSGSGDHSGTSRENRAGSDEGTGTVGGGNLQ